MNEPQGNFIKLRNRNIPKLVPPTKKIETSTPIKKSPPNLENLRQSVQESTKFLRELSNNVDNNLSSLESVISSKMTCQPTTIYNKELADLMATNIPKFNLNSGNNPALGLRSFIKSCENVLNLFDPDDEDVVTEFFKLIKFRLGYDVQERLTIEQFDDIQSLENHLRSVCHLKLNKGKLLSEIRHEKQHFNEDVSNFVERLRKLIAQGRSEYPKDKEFEKEAIHTLKNSVKNELISIKLMDSDSNKFEELAELAINRDSDLHQRAYRTSKPNDSVSQDLVNELLQKIKKLEEKQTATIQHIRQEQKFKNKPIPNSQHFLPRDFKRNPNFCNYCKRNGHLINECRQKFKNQEQIRYPNSKLYQNSTNQHINNFQNTNRFPNQANDHFVNNNGRNNFNNQHARYPQNNFRMNYPNNNRNFQRPNNNLTPRFPGPQIDYSFTPVSYNPFPNMRQYQSNSIGNDTCLRCNQTGHKSNNCYEIICSTCKNIGHSLNQCPQSSNIRRVHLTQCNQDCQSHESPDQGNQ